MFIDYKISALVLEDNVDLLITYPISFTSLKALSVLDLMGGVGFI